GSNVTINQGESTTLGASGADSYLWNTGATSQSITVSPNTTTAYTVTGTSNAGCEATDSVTVTVLTGTGVTADAGEDVAICEGTGTTLTATGGSSYEWSNGATTASIDVSPSATTTYTVTAYDAAGNNSDTDDVVVTVNPIPDVHAGNSVTINSGESTTLNASGASSYLWNTGETSQSITISPAQTTTYTVTGDLNGCEGTDSVTVTVIEETVVADAGENRTICRGTDVTLTAWGGDSYLWNTGATTQSINVSPNNTTTYSVTVFGENVQDSDSVTVFVDPNPVVAILNGEDVTILEGEYVTLSASGANTYEWNNGASQPNIAVSPNSTTNYSVTGYINDCSDTDVVTVNVVPRVSAAASDDQTICMNESVALSASGGDEFLWSTGETTSSILVSPAETTEYSVTVYNELDYDTTEVMVTVENCADIETPEDAESLEFMVYPNPTSGNLNIKITGLLKVSSITLYDLAGKMLFHEIKIGRAHV